MFYFTCNESKIYESFTFWNKLQEKMNFFHDILIYWYAPVLTKLSSLIHLYSSFYNSLTVKQLSTKSNVQLKASYVSRSRRNVRHADPFADFYL